MKPKISIIVPVKNGAPWLNEVLKAYQSQSLFDQSEVVIVDSGSTDDTLSILRNYPTKIVSIPPEEFNHGETRNLGVRQARGEFVVLTVQDAVPRSRFWLEDLLKGFLHDGVAGVCGKQVVPHRKEYNPIQWSRPVSAPQIKEVKFSKGEFAALDGPSQFKYCRWDDVSSMYRRSDLLQTPFRRVPFAEDILWARDALTRGKSIVYNPFAEVEHYHHESVSYSFRRHLFEIYSFYKNFGVLPAVKTNKQIFSVYLSWIKTLWRIPIYSPTEKMMWFNYNRRLFDEMRKAEYILIDSASKGAEAVEKLFAEWGSVVPVATTASLIGENGR